MKNIQRRPLVKAICADLIIYAFFCVLLWWLGAYNFSYQEHLGTLYYQGYHTLRVIENPAGLSKIIAAFITQFFISPAAGVLITAALLALIMILTARVIRYISGTLAYTPLAFLPAIAIAFLHYNVNYLYEGTIAMILMLVADNVMFKRGYQMRYFTDGQKLFYCSVATFFLYAAGGAIAFLFGVTLCLACIFKSPKRALTYLICPVITVIQAWISVRSGLVCDMAHALLPIGYFTHRLEPTGLVYLPWILMCSVLTLGSFLGLFERWSERVKWTLFWVLLFVSVAFAVTGGLLYVDQQNEMFKKLNCLIRQERWEEINDMTTDTELRNMLLQDCNNLAWAERGLLGDHLFEQPCVDIRNIYIKDYSSPYNNMLLSDIYYSMGHIALAQRHAFEANEALDDESPRMLQRLADTNIIFGNYKTAEKYIHKLEHTLFYRDWAKQHRALLSDEAVMADSVLSQKRKCLIPDNRFSAAKGLDDDLTQIARANPDHTATVQYLASLYLLSKDMPRFAGVIEEFYGDGELPIAFQEGVLAYDVDSITARYQISPEVKARYEDFKTNPTAHPKTLWHFLRYVK